MTVMLQDFCEKRSLLDLLGNSKKVCIDVTISVATEGTLHQQSFHAPLAMTVNLSPDWRPSMQQVDGGVDKSVDHCDRVDHEQESCVPCTSAQRQRLLSAGYLAPGWVLTLPKLLPVVTMYVSLEQQIIFQHKSGCCGDAAIINLLSSLGVKGMNAQTPQHCGAKTLQQVQAMNIHVVDLDPADNIVPVLFSPDSRMQGIFVP
jgi:hypothetical protein